jgi:hypothetical protein
MGSQSLNPEKRVCRNNLKIAARVVGALAVCLSCLPLFSQTSQGTIQGGVFDQSGGVVAGATVSVIDVARGVTRALTADDAGQYIANDLIPGTYTVRAEAKGFRTVEHSGVLVEVGRSIRVDLVLQPGEQTQTITVTGEVPAIDATDATLGGTVSNLSINALPLNGRNFERLLQVRPGVISSVGSGTGTSSTNGRRSDQDLLRLEGIAGIADSVGSTLLNASYKGGDASSLVSIDAIQEFSSEQNPKAEYGFRNGSVINVGIKSGTNGLHGTAYAFGRDAAATDSANYFTGMVTPANLEQFGATAGGPILKDKLFWFAGYEGLRVTVGDVGVPKIPSSIAMSPSVDPNNQLSMVNACQFLGPAKINGLSAQLAGLNPNTCVVTPASPTFENVFPYVNSATSNNFAPGIASQAPLNNGLFKGDYVLGPHQHLSGLVFISKSQGVSAGATILLPQWAASITNNAQQYSGDWTWTPNSTWVNDLRMGYVFIRNITLIADANLLPSNPWPNGYSMNTGVTNPLYGGLPTINITGFASLGGGKTRTTRRGPQGDVDLVESVSYLHGKHVFKFGFEYLDMVYDGDSFTGAQGVASFASLQTFLQGTPKSGSILLGNPDQNTRMHWYGGFVQDDWRIKPRITLNLGLRYENYAPPTERHNYLGNFDPNVTGTAPAVLQFGPGAPIASEFKANLGELSPRLGVAWDVRGDGKTVVRAGAALLTAPSVLTPFITQSPFGANFPSIGVNNTGTDISLHTPDPITLSKCATSVCPGQWNWNLTGVPIFPTAGATGITCAPAGIGTPCQTGAVDPNFKQASAAEWNVDIQRAITNNLTVDVAYVGNHGFNEEAIVDLNQPALGAGWDAGAVGACLASANDVTKGVATPYDNCVVNTAAEVGPYRSKFPYLSQIDETTYGDFSNYDGLQATLQARNYHGLSFLASYTYSHSLDVLVGNTGGGQDTLPTDKNNLRLDYGNGDYDLRHRFTFSPTYLIPGTKAPAQMLEGWSVSGILTVQSGLPWTAADLTTTDWLGTSEINNGQIGGGVYQYWNYSGSRSAFSNTGPNPIPCYGTYGGCTPYTSASYAGAIQTACQNAAQSPYTGNAQLQSLALAALANGACYIQNGGVLTPPAFGTVGNAGRGFFRGQPYRNVDISVSKIWKFKERYSAQFRLEFFNLFNHTDFAAPGTDPTSPAGFGYSTNTPDSGNPVLGSGGPRHIQFGLKLAF